MASLPEPFKFLTPEEFAELTKDEKPAYLNMAAEVILHEAPVVGVIRAAKHQLH